MTGIVVLERARRLLLSVGLMFALLAGLAVVGLLAGAASALAAPPAFTPVAGSPFATGDRPESVPFSASGGLLATANEGANTVSVFSVGSGGALTAVAGSPFATGSARSRWRSARAGGCSRPPTSPPTRCRCSRSAPAAR